MDNFRREMLSDNKLRVIHDYLDAKDCFPGVDIKGGVCYFLWNRDKAGLCRVITHENGKITSDMERPLIINNTNIFIRYNDAISILNKVLEKNEQSFGDIVSYRQPFGLESNFNGFIEESKDTLKVYANKKVGYMDKRHQSLKNLDSIDKWKILIPKAMG